MKKTHLITWLLLFICSTVSAQITTISGTVTDKKNKDAIIGATVYAIENIAGGTKTDENGTYTLKIASFPQTIRVSFIGYQTYTLKVDKEGTYNVSLEIDDQLLDEVVVGYSSRKRQDLTGSIETIKAENIEQIPNASFTQTLQGKASGLLSATSSGRPGAEAEILIRGMNSVNASNTPLYVIDGIPMSGGNFSNLNPNDIETITILKDASAAAIYGSRATSGVIVITTKKGKAMEKAAITYRGQLGVTQLMRNPYDMMNTEEKLTYEEYVLLNNGDTYLSRYGSNYMDSLSSIDENWFDALFQKGRMESHEIAVRGGNEKTKYYTSLSYLSQDGILPRSDFNRYNMRLNLETELNNISRIGTFINIGHEKTNYSSAEDGGPNVYNPAFAAYLINPYINVYDQFGKYNDDGFILGGNPLKELQLNYLYANSLETTMSNYLELEPVENLKLKTTLGVNYSNNDYKSYLSPFSKWGAESDGEITKTWEKYIKLVSTTTASYKATVADYHNLSAIVGHEAIGGYLSDLGATVRVLPNDKVDVISEGADPQKPSETISEYRVISYFSALYYDFNKKYYLDLSFRRDGCSRFGVNNRWANFSSIGIQWNMKKESLFQSIDWLSKLKLFGGFGSTGNYAIGNYAAMSLYGYSSYANLAAGALSNPGNDDLTWEKALKTNLGLDLAINRRYSLKIELYNNTTSELLFTVPYSATTGFSGGLDNVGELRNRGVELSADLLLVDKKDFSWQINGNISYNQNEVIALYGEETEIDNGNTIIKIGEPLGAIQSVRYAGVNPATGEPLWYDKNGKLTDTYSDDDRVLLGKSYLPPLQASLNTSVSYKNISLNVFFTGMFKKYLYNNNRFFIESDGEFAAYGQSRKMLDHWKNIGDLTDIPNPRFRNKYADDRLIEDASFIRLKNVTLSYSLPQNLLSRITYISNCRFYAQGQNLLTFTKYTGFDPEYMSGLYEVAAYPQPKTFTFGVDITF